MRLNSMKAPRHNPMKITWFGVVQFYISVRDSAACVCKTRRRNAIHLGLCGGECVCKTRKRNAIHVRLRVGECEGREQDWAAGLEQGLLQNALQLSDVARPRVTAQPLQRLRSDLLYLAPQLLTEAAQVVPRQQRQIVAALAQGGADG
jgi:hypothetical protein